MMTPTEEYYEKLLAVANREAERYNGMHQIAVMEIERLRDALEAVVRDVNDYERVNNLSPSHSRSECWDSVAHAKNVLARVGSPGNSK